MATKKGRSRHYNLRYVRITANGVSIRYDKFDGSFVSQRRPYAFFVVLCAFLVSFVSLSFLPLCRKNTSLEGFRVRDFQGQRRALEGVENDGAQHGRAQSSRRGG